MTKRDNDPPRWKSTPEESEDAVRANWRRFREANPGHRPNAKRKSRLCLRMVAREQQAGCRTEGCPGCTGTEAIRRILDHGEHWDCQVDQRWAPAIAAHKYAEHNRLIEEVRGVLDSLGADGRKLRAYVSPSTAGWYYPPQAVTLLIQPVGATAIAGGTEVSADPTGESGEPGTKRAAEEETSQTRALTMRAGHALMREARRQGEQRSGHSSGWSTSRSTVTRRPGPTNSRCWRPGSGAC